MHTTDLFTTLFVHIDDALKSFSPRPRTGGAPLVSDSEILTLLITQCLHGQESDRAWLRHVDRYYRHLFPHVPDRTRYLRRRQLLQGFVAPLMAHLCRLLDPDTAVRIVDSAPIPVCHNVRAKTCRSFAGDATWGKCAAKGSWVFGFKLHLMVTDRGLPVAADILGANRHDRIGLDGVLEGRMNEDIYGDAAYHVLPEDRRAFAERGITITAQPREYLNEILPPERQDRLDEVRFTVEQVFAQLDAVTGIETTLARTLPALKARIAFKLVAFGFAQWLNVQLNRPRRHIKALFN